MFKFCFILFATPLFALPEGGRVVAGNAEIWVKEKKIEVVQTSQNAILEWESFSLDSFEAIEFFVPMPGGTVMNRIAGSSASSIQGSIKSPGEIYLVNPAGIHIGAEGVIQAEEFLASTLIPPDLGYLSNTSLYFSGSSFGEITHRGSLEATDGSLFLIAPHIIYEGNARATRAVSMAAGSQVYLCGCSAQRLWILSPPEEGRIELRGHIEAGLVEARLKGGCIEQNGGISSKEKAVLSAEKGLLEIEGRLESCRKDRFGGEIELIGNEIWMGQGAVLDASGCFGGGVIHIGGDINGKNGSLPTACKVHAEKGSSLIADAKEIGRGGKVVFHGDKVTWFDGSISVKGGPFGGDGGIACLSLSDDFRSLGAISIEAPAGMKGEIVLR